MFNTKNMNLYNYTMQNPVNLVDPDGNSTSIDQDGKPYGNIDLSTSNKTGRDFLVQMAGTFISDYIPNARNGEKYDFKTNGMPKNLSRAQKDQYKYRGSYLFTDDGSNVYASARDFGNAAAGLVAGGYEIPYFMARVAFDAYESKSRGIIKTEYIGTKLAEKFGHNLSNGETQ